MDVEITIASRPAQTKGEAKKLRREGTLPAVIYSQANAPESISLSTTAFQTVLRNVRPGFLPTTIFKLVDSKGKTRRAIVKDIQYAVTTYDVLHLDFLELDNNTSVSLNVPVEYTNQVDCVGVKLGGFLRSIMRHLKVKCLPKDIPTHFEIDVKDLNINQFKKVKDMTMPAGVVYLGRQDDVVVSVVKK